MQFSTKLGVVLMGVLLVLAASFPAGAETISSVWVDGARYDVNALNRSGHIMVNSADLAAALGAEVEEGESTIAFSDGDLRVVLYQREDGLWEITGGTTGARRTIPAEAAPTGDLVPLRAVAETLGANVWWMPRTKAVVIDRRGYTYYETSDPEAADDGSVRLLESANVHDGVAYIYEKARPGEARVRFKLGAVLYVDDEMGLGALYSVGDIVMVKASVLLKVLGSGAVATVVPDDDVLILIANGRAYVAPADGDFERPRNQGYSWSGEIAPVPYQGDWLVPLAEVGKALGYTYWPMEASDRHILESRGREYKEAPYSGLHNPSGGIRIFWCKWTPEWSSKGLAPDPGAPSAGDPVDQICVYQIDPNWVHPAEPPIILPVEPPVVQ